MPETEFNNARGGAALNVYRQLQGADSAGKICAQALPTHPVRNGAEALAVAVAA